MLSKLKVWFKEWWRRNIVDYCTPELEDEEFYDKYR